LQLNIKAQPQMTQRRLPQFTYPGADRLASQGIGKAISRAFDPSHHIITRGVLRSAAAQSSKLKIPARTGGAKSQTKNETNALSNSHSARSQCHRRALIRKSNNRSWLCRVITVAAAAAARCYYYTLLAVCGPNRARFFTRAIFLSHRNVSNMRWSSQRDGK
jgi:hypothetical protein